MPYRGGSASHAEPWVVSLAALGRLRWGGWWRGWRYSPCRAVWLSVARVRKAVVFPGSNEQKRKAALPHTFESHSTV